MAKDEKHRYPLIPVDCPVDCDFNSNFTATYGIELGLYQNSLIRCLNSVYYNSVRVKPGDEAAFVGYCLSLVGSIHGHQEEGMGKIWLPFVQAKYDTSPHFQRHARCDEKLKPFEEYMKKVSSSEQAYDGQKVRELVESFGDYIVKTFHNEVRVTNDDNGSFLMISIRCRHWPKNFWNSLRRKMLTLQPTVSVSWPNSVTSQITSHFCRAQRIPSKKSARNFELSPYYISS